MKIALLNPPPIQETRYIREGRCMQSVDSWAAVWPPLTLAVLAATARRHGEVDLYDCNVEEQSGVAAVVDRLKEFDPDVVVVNTSFPSIESDNACADAVKKACPRAVIVGFGVFFTLLEQKAMEACPAFDLGVVGEPEDTFHELLIRLKAGSQPGPMRGLMWREPSGVAMGPARPAMEDLDVLPFAARDLLRNDRYVLPHNGRPFTLINVARGCPYPCIYCIAPAYYGKKMRKHSVGYVMEEIEHCRRALGIRDFLFWEEVFTLDKPFGLQLCAAIRSRQWDISWATTTRADQVDEEILAAMKSAGCTLLGLGIETAHQHILDNAKKHATVAQMRRAVRLCRQAGLKTMGHFIFGLPGETAQTADETVKFGRELGLDYLQCYCAVPYPKTELGELARRNGWLLSDRWSDYDFGGSSIMNIGTIPPQAVDEARRQMFRRFYFRPRFFLSQLGNLLAHPRQVVQASRFLNWMRTSK